MKLETDHDHCEFIPENEEEKKLIEALYESLSKEDKERKFFGSNVINLDNESGSLHITTYV